MSDQTTSPVPPNLVPAEQLYDVIMQTIEPELMHKTLPSLGETYAHEVPEDTARRAQRYQAAFALYQKRLDEYMSWAGTQVRHYRKHMLTHYEGKQRAVEQQAIDYIESLLA